MLTDSAVVVLNLLSFFKVKNVKVNSKADESVQNQEVTGFSESSRNSNINSLEEQWNANPR